MAFTETIITNPMQFYLSDDEQYILTAKFKASGMKSMSNEIKIDFAVLPVTKCQ